MDLWSYEIFYLLKPWLVFCICFRLRNISPDGETGIVSRFFVAYDEILNNFIREPVAAKLHESGDVIRVALRVDGQGIFLIILHKPADPKPVRCLHGGRSEPAAPDLAVYFYLIALHALRFFQGVKSITVKPPLTVQKRTFDGQKGTFSFRLRANYQKSTFLCQKSTY
jgi:hypothetical protein